MRKGWLSRSRGRQAKASRLDPGQRSPGVRPQQLAAPAGTGLRLAAASMMVIWMVARSAASAAGDLHAAVGAGNAQPGWRAAACSAACKLGPLLRAQHLPVSRGRGPLHACYSYAYALLICTCICICTLPQADAHRATGERCAGSLALALEGAAAGLGSGARLVHLAALHIRVPEKAWLPTGGAAGQA